MSRRFHYEEEDEPVISAYDMPDEVHTRSGKILLTEDIQGSNIPDQIFIIIKRSDISDINEKNFGKNIKDYDKIYKYDSENSVFKEIVNVGIDEGEYYLILSDNEKVLNEAEEIVINIYNIPVPENTSDIIELFVKPSLLLQEKFNQYYNRVNEITSSLSGRISAGNFMADKGSFSYDNYISDMKTYYTLCNSIKNIYQDCTFPATVYRSVSQSTGYNPILFKEGEIIPQLYPISTSMHLEFPVYLWMVPRQYCCLLAIRVDDLYNCSIPTVEYNNENMYDGIYHKSINYQSEINLKPGIFTIDSIKDITIPTLSDYKNLLLDMYKDDSLHIEKLEKEKAIRTLNKVDCEFTRCKERDIIRVINISYRPYDFEELKSLARQR